MTDIWILSSAFVIAVSCALAGSFLVIRHQSMLSDAISHAVLPGLVIAFLLSGSRASFPMLIGAAFFGILCVYLVELFHSRAKVPLDASIGISFTWLFAIGIILISRFSGQIDLDQDCVLHGEIAFAPLMMERIPFTEIFLPRPLLIGSLMLLIVLALITWAYKGIQLTSFNPDYATSLGVSVVLWHYLVSGLISMLTVTAFESVGAVLVIALLVIPGATAWLLFKKIKSLLIAASVIAILGCLAGYYLAIVFNASIAGAIAMCLFVLFLFVLMFTKMKRIKN